MLYTNYTEDLIGLKDVIVTRVEKVDGHARIFLKTKLQMQVCPNCRHETKRVHSYRTQPVKDLPLFGLKTILYLKKRRYYCPHCSKVFFEKLSFLPKYQRNTTRLYAQVVEAFHSEHSTKSIATMYNISPAVATRMFDRISYPKPKLPQVLSIDEFKGNAGNQKFQCILTDAKKRKVLDILPSRRSEDLYAYFLSFDRASRNNVKYIVMDMSLLFREVMLACFPNAQIITDKFHVCRHVTWSIESIRKKEQKKFSDERRKYFKKSRWLILKRQSKLKEENLIQLENMLNVSPKLREAYWLKERFYQFMDSKNLEEAKTHLKEWNLCVGVTDLEEFKKCFEMINRWQPYILRAFSLGYTNGFTEGCNNRIKVLKRNCYGIKNFSRFRNRILHMMAG
ncbi:MAG: ISL3 family transposase [Anaerovoracaceae bacterium]|jgi:transposase|nr:ISL3 family transposase [Clostridiales bacterium]